MRMYCMVYGVGTLYSCTGGAYACTAYYSVQRMVTKDDGRQFAVLGKV